MFVFYTFSLLCFFYTFYLCFSPSVFLSWSITLFSSITITLLFMLSSCPSFHLFPVLTGTGTWGTWGKIGQFLCKEVETLYCVRWCSADMYMEIKKADYLQQMVLYCKTYCSLNMFWAPLCPSSGAQEYYTGGCCLWYLVLWFTGCQSGVEL